LQAAYSGPACRCIRSQGQHGDPFEFLFGASGRFNRAKYWRSVLLYAGAGLMTAVILFTAAGIAGANTYGPDPLLQPKRQA
jgi:uncharacterized membrane protein YhaH (DUF805 family)